MRSFLVPVLLLATSALAIRPGDKLFIVSKDTKVRKEPNLKAAAVITVQAGMPVVWNGASTKDAEWHEISVNGKKGFVQRAELSPSERALEIDSSTLKPMSAQAFAASSSGVIKCSFGPPQGNYAKSGGPAQDEATAELIYLEELNRQQAVDAAKKK